MPGWSPLLVMLAASCGTITAPVVDDGGGPPDAPIVATDGINLDGSADGADGARIVDAVAVRDAAVRDAVAVRDAAARPDGPRLDASPARPWHAGTFRALPVISDDLTDFVAGLSHPNAGGYGKLSTNRRAAFQGFLTALFDAIDRSLVDGDAADWCAVQQLADDAGYELARFHDTVSGRWFVYGRDTTSYGQAYFFVNPQAKRDLVIEAPHAPYDASTDVQSARIFRALAARAFLLNKEHRCSDPDSTTCSGSGGNACEGRYRESDVAHHPANTFHVFHRFLSDLSGPRFVQLHGMVGSDDDNAEIADCSTQDVNPASVSVEFATNLDAYVPGPSTVDSCQAYAGSPPDGLCGSTNIQGRYTNNPSGDECTVGTPRTTGRFLHVEQRATLRDTDNDDGYYWGDVRDALRDTWPECTLNDGASDCTLGPAQDEPPGCVCGETC